MNSPGKVFATLRSHHFLARKTLWQFVEAFCTVGWGGGIECEGVNLIYHGYEVHNYVCGKNSNAVINGSQLRGAEIKRKFQFVWLSSSFLMFSEFFGIYLTKQTNQLHVFAAQRKINDSPNDPHRSCVFVLVLVCLHKNNGKWNKWNNMPLMLFN
jgi:hypothetical protein